MQYKVLIFSKNLMFRPISIIFVSGRAMLDAVPDPERRSGVRTRNGRQGPSGKGGRICFPLFVA